jgi:diacylglycerol kinase family enzyme
MSAPSINRRVAAILSLLVYAGAVVVVVLALTDHLLVLLLAVAALIAATAAAWFAVTRTGASRVVAVVATAVLLAAAVVALVADASIRDLVLAAALLAAASLLARYALGFDRGALRAAPPAGESAPRPAHPVLIMNPRSGGGKVTRFALADEARARGVEAVMLEPGADLEALARDAVARGADVLGMAGGDGSQALVASIAAEHHLPFVCVPAGTRNHLALDLGVDRDDVVGSLDALVDGYERTIDLARVNGRVFVNNVSLGVYAEIVQSDEYRDAKLQTAATMLPELLGPTAARFSFALDTPSGEPLADACLVLVSNNVYRLDRLGGFGTRERIDGGELGVVALGVRNAAAAAELVSKEMAGRVSSYSGWNEWAAPMVEITATGQVAAGVDGEALVLTPPLRFEVIPGALRVRLARSAPGVSPAAIAARTRQRGLVELFRVAAGRSG